jgi:hypothetical protein
MAPQTAQLVSVKSRPSLITELGAKYNVYPFPHPLTKLSCWASLAMKSLTKDPLQLVGPPHDAGVGLIVQETPETCTEELPVNTKGEPYQVGWAE